MDYILLERDLANACFEMLKRNVELMTEIGIVANFAVSVHFNLKYYCTFVKGKKKKHKKNYNSMYYFYIACLTAPGKYYKIYGSV